MTADSKLHRLPLAEARASSSGGKEVAFAEKRSQRRSSGERKSAKSAGKALQAELQRRLLDKGPPVCIIDEKGKILYSNPPFEEIKRSLAAEDALPRFLAPLSRSQERSEDESVTIKTPEGNETYRVERQSLENEESRAAAYIYWGTPSEGKARQMIALLNTRLDDVTRLVSDWLWECDRDLCFTFVSPRVTDVLGYHPFEIIGTPIAEFLRNLPACLEKIICKGERRPFRNQEVAIVHKDGSERRFYLSALPVYDSVSGDFLGLRGTAEDVTALRSRERALLEAKESAELANRAKTEFLANMSHELRTPLNAVIGFSEIMEQELLGPLGNDQYRNYVHDIHSSAHHLLKLINDILDISKIEAGNHELMEEAFDPGRIVESVGRLIAERCFRAGQKFEVLLPEGLPLLYGDERKIKQVLLNLLANATKFTPEGGKIQVSAALKPDGGFLFKVADTGIGIAPQNLAKAFAPFQQVDSRLSRQYEGTGLGLPLSRGIMRLHGGDLTLESKPNKGTCAIATLPHARVLI